MASELIARVTEGVRSVQQDPSIQLDRKLFEQAEIVLPDHDFNPAQRRSFVESLVDLIPTLQQDPSPVTSLLDRMIRIYSYSDLTGLFDFAILTAGLNTGEHMIAFNNLALTVLEKAAQTSADAATIATLSDTFLALVRLWLCTHDTGVAARTSQVLLDLLRVDQERTAENGSPASSSGQGLVWKRVFTDRDVYGTLFSACSLTVPSELKLGNSQISLAQARLLEWLPQVARMNWDAVARSNLPEVESKFGVQGGVLDFAALKMVDTKDDVLMYRCLIDFYTELLKASPTSSAGSGLEYLVSHSLHTRTANIYIQPPGASVDPLDSMFLYGPAANYVAVYSTTHRSHFLTSAMPAQVIKHLQQALDLSPGKWAHSESPKHDLHVLASIPRKALMDSCTSSAWSSNPISLLPTKSTNPDVLHTLATVFHGPIHEITFPAATTTSTEQEEEQEEATCARALYYHYLASNPSLYRDLTTHASVLALKDLALAAINLIHSIITAPWPASTLDALPLPTARIPCPAAGHEALLAPPALETALPWLLAPPQSTAHLVGGDPESAAWALAAAKLRCLQAFRDRLDQEVKRGPPGRGYEAILETVERRLAQGVSAGGSGEVGARVATLGA